MKCWQIVLLLPLFALTWAPAAAEADSSVVVLGVRSLDGDDALARDVSQALREGAKQVSAWKISERDISLAQMSLAHGCEEPDARCMADIASTLEVDRLIYGTMVRREPNIDVTLFNFDAVTGQVETSLSEKVPAESLTGVALKATTAGLARRLAGIRVTGALRVRGAAGARVSLDGKEIGVLDAEGALLLAGIAVGRHTLVLSQGAARAEQAIEIREAETTTTQLALDSVESGAPSEQASAVDTHEAARPAPDDSRRRRIAGYTALGVAGAFALATTYSWVRIVAIDDDLAPYRNKFTRNDDICANADDGVLAMRSPELAGLEASARGLCRDADTMEVLQYVFLGSALATAGVGTYLLLTKAPASEPLSVVVQPRLAHGRGLLSATLRF